MVRLEWKMIGHASSGIYQELYLAVLYLLRIEFSDDTPLVFLRNESS